MIKRITMNLRLSAAAAAALTLAACNNSPTDDTPAPEPEESGKQVLGEGTSIIRADVEMEREIMPLEPLESRISFDEGGYSLSETAIAELKAVLESRQYTEGGDIVLRGHTDAGGNDNANLRASERRAEAVKDWFVENGTAEDRITVVGLGEQNPARPNANPDGTPNDENRAYNRRVMVHIAVPEELVVEETPDTPTLVEKVTAD
ncbi:OmpA family protein [Altererythrobacter luteolus]|uniref:OmpA family protein n=1 Tax=Pontixanthobacter luteolus TaxID=295089 RepID=A0A6I4V563_9SPHN|nr:OmpA family protein [Pontixanthobacter luteolus]MXP48010.1 OmpA family protein [Pontixanthobacter luteolus]